jgi:hypothetical protein
MTTEKTPIDRTIYATNAMRSDGRVKAYINTQGVQTKDFTGYLAEVFPGMSEYQAAIIKNLGGTATRLGRANNTLVLFSEEAAKNLFPIPEEATIENAKMVGQALVDIFYTERNNIPY